MKAFKNDHLLNLLVLFFSFALIGCDQQTELPTHSWKNSSPEDENIKESVLDELHQEFLSGKHGYIDGMLVFKNNKLVYEKNYKNNYLELSIDNNNIQPQYNYYNPTWHPFYQDTELHTVQSISKSVTSALIGIAINRGELIGPEEKIMPYFENYSLIDDDPRRSEIKLIDLLTMTAGIKWDESTYAYTDPRNNAASMENSNEWVEYILNQPMSDKPGNTFVYNSGITVLLSHILFSVTGEHTNTYAEKFLFKPLGIKDYYWKITPTGLVDTEGGLYLKPKDLAKIGLLYANDGIWEGKKLFPDGWVQMTMMPNVDVPESKLKYGYQWWLTPYDETEAKWAFTGIGYGGQYLFVLPDYNCIAVFTGWNIYDDRRPSTVGTIIGAEFLLGKILESLN